MKKLMAVCFALEGEELTIVLWDEKGKKTIVTFPIEFLLDFLDDCVENAKEN